MREKATSTVKSKIAQYITQMRQKLGLTKTGLAKAIKKTQPYITQIESGLRIPNHRLVKDICDALNATTEERERALYLCVSERNPELGKRLKALEESITAKEEELKRLRAESFASKSLAGAADKNATYGEGKSKRSSIEVPDDSLAPFVKKGTVALLAPNRAPKAGDIVAVIWKTGRIVFGRYHLVGKKPLIVNVNPITVVEPTTTDGASEIAVVTGYVFAKN